MNNNKNNNNKKLDFLSKILLVVIILSFVFSAVALGRSCSVNTASADTVVSSVSYNSFTLFEPDTLEPVEYSNFNTSSYYAFSSSYSSSFDLFFTYPDASHYLSFEVTNINNNSCHINIFDMYNLITYFEADYFYIVDGYFVFSLSSFSYDLHFDTPITCLGVDGLDLYLYSASPYPIVSDSINAYTLFSAAVVTYKVRGWHDEEFDDFSISAPVDIDIDNSRVYFNTLYNSIPDNIKSLDFVSNGNINYLDSFYITFPLNTFNLFSLQLIDFPFIISSNYSSVFAHFGVGLFGVESSARTYVYNYEGYISFGAPPNSLSIAGTDNIVTCDFIGFNYAGPAIFPSGVTYTDDDFVSCISLLNSSFIAVGSNFTNGYNAGFAEGSADSLRIYNQGYADGQINGASNANQYTFYGLISAVVDAPIKAVTGLLNFTFLGVNLFAFFTGLLTVALILFIVKKIFGG